jgi:hypothetical protein
MPWDELPEDFRHLALVNEEKRYSIWRGHVAIPAGWSVAQGGWLIPTASTRSGTKPRPGGQLRCTAAIPARPMPFVRPGTRGAQPALEGFRLPSTGGDSTAVPFPK